MKRSNFYNQLAALILLISIISACTDDESPSLSQSKLTTEEITSLELPDGVLDQLSGIKSASSGRENGLGDLEIDTEKIIKATYSETRESFVLRSKTDDINTINVIFKLIDGDQEAFIVHYQPDQEWYDNKPNELSFIGFTGVIDFYNLEVELISSSIYVNGTAISLNGKQLSGGRSICYTHVESFSEFCEHENHIEYHSDGTCSHPIEGVTFEIICEDSWSSGSGGSTSGTGDNYNGTNGSSGGGGTSGSGPNDDFVPINPDDLDDDGCTQDGFVLDDNGDCIPEEEYWESEVCTSQAFNSNSCLSSVWGKLKSTNAAISLLDKFENSSWIDLCIDANLSTSANAQTSISGSNATINFNISKLGRSQLSIARTFFHELIHAELFRKVTSVGGQVSQNDFPGIYDYYRRFYKNWQHQQMAAHYINSIAEGLSLFDGASQQLSYYKDIAWIGLWKVPDYTTSDPNDFIETQAWEDLSTQEQDRIKNAIASFQSNENTSCQ